MEPFTLILAAMLAQSTAAAPPPSPPPAAVRADADGDGTVSRQEYLARFDRMDTNRDGQLSRDERRAAMPRMRGGRQGRPRDGDDRRSPPPGDDRKGGDRTGGDRMGDREVTRADFVAKGRRTLRPDGCKPGRQGRSCGNDGGARDASRSPRRRRCTTAAPGHRARPRPALTADRAERRFRRPALPSRGDHARAGADGRSAAPSSGR